MGSEIFCAVDSERASVKERLERVPAMFEAWEKTLSRFRANSELSQLNARGGENVRVSETLWRVLQVAQRAELWSDGLVTPLILNALEAAGYARTFSEIHITHRVSSVSVRERFLREEDNLREGGVVNPLPRWEMNPTTHSVCVERGARLDLGGVAKGWAAEQTARYLGEMGAALVDAGGDMVMTAPPAEGAWHIGIENPFAPDDDDVPTVQIARGAVATSGRDFRKWTRDGKPAHHLIDPRSGLPAVTDVLTATVIAPTIFQAEVAAKVALLLGSVNGLAWLEARELAARLILEDGNILTSARMEDFLV
ncbi:MAG: hypothetical protein B6D41_12100 [Chloroflexi bacterium UTCFX4]|nr:MAG: hypothetical protein B6D41_12100 [Chloroflexi bacterium UTCFX4]